MEKYVLECCVDRLSSAINAEKGGATELELCANLVIGGTTPSITLFRQVRENTKLPIHVLIRNRFGDFLYDECEIEEMCDSIKAFVAEGADAVVVGALTAEGELDTSNMKRFIKSASGIKVVLHRAFDMCQNPFKTLEEAKMLGLHTVLTSGQKQSAIEGSGLIAELIKAAGEDINILTGAGINAAAIEKLYPLTNGRRYHMSGKIVTESGMSYRKAGVSMGLPSFSEYEIWETSEEEVRKAAEVLSRMAG